MQLVIVESPAKAKTIEKYLGKDYKVLASYGHVRDLPPKDGSVNPDEGFAMSWENYGDKGKQLKLITDEEAGKLVNEEEIKIRAIANAEQNGIVFIDEIDKVAARQETSGSDVSRQRVQRDLLPLVEGTTVSTKYGMIKTDHILFIASGAFHLSKPSDLIPELQGRFPIRVELESLSVKDFEAILTQTHASLVKQYQALLATEGVTLEFLPEGITRLAHIAYEVNERTENIGARRLSTVMERLLDEVSFDATRLGGQTVSIDAAYVDARLQSLSQDEDLSRYIL